MASRISQMRNGMLPPQAMTSQPPRLPLEEMKGLMRQVRNAQNPQTMLAQIIQNNPNAAALSQMLRGGNSLEGIARQMAQVGGYDINEIIRELGGA